jgi:hypothetical protein
MTSHPLAIETEGLVKVFGTTRAVDGVDLFWMTFVPNGGTKIIRRLSP